MYFEHLIYLPYFLFLFFIISGLIFFYQTVLVIMQDYGFTFLLKKVQGDKYEILP